MLESGTYQTLRIDRHDNGVVAATLNRPAKRNAVDDTMHEELARLFVEADDDRELRVLLLTGAGKAFCAGGDFSGGLSPGPQLWAVARRVVNNLLDFRKPLISAVNGAARGLGATLALLSDIVVAVRNASFADTHAPMGLGAGDGGQVIWPLLIGVNRAKYYLMTGESLSAEEAERLGLVNFVVADEELSSRAMQIAGKLAQGAPLAISASKVPINAYIKTVADTILPLSLQLEEATMMSSDFQEAVLAFAEKRPPRFRG